MLAYLGFSSRWRDWISLILRCSSPRVLVNRVMGHRFLHRWGLRQGDPLSPCSSSLSWMCLMQLSARPLTQAVFSPLMTVLHNIVLLSMPMIWSSFFLCRAGSRVRPRHHLCLWFNLRATHQFCQMFDNPDLSFGRGHGVGSELFPCSIFDFPFTYLCIPLSVCKLPKAAMQPLIDKVSH